MTASAAPQQYPKGSILDIASTIVPNSFEEKLAKDLRVCPSTGKSVSIAYHAFGESSNPLVLLIPGLGCQCLTIYDTATCTWLASQGLYVVRMDNRDVGLSTTFDDVPQRLIMPLMIFPNWMAFGEKQPYTLDDMADDASALIKYLCAQNKTNAAAAHVVGVSMGGMIAQCVGLRNPELVRSLTLVMTHSGNHGVARTPLRTMIGLLYKPKSDSVEDLVAHNDWFFQNYLLGAPSSSRHIADLHAKEFGRSNYCKGTLRQMAAIQRAPSRDEALKSVAIPTHVMHGEKDALLPIAFGHHLARLIPNAKLSTYSLMGHFVDDDHAQIIADDIFAFIQQSGTVSAAATV